MSKPSFLRRFFSGIWHLITWIRLALANVLFLVLLVVLYFVLTRGGPEPLPPKAALLLNPVGFVVDQRAPIDPFETFFVEPDPANNEVALQDMLDAIDYAAKDPAINSLVLELDNLMGVGISKTSEISRALEAFRATGKPIIARGDYFTQDQYLLASQADTVIMHPLGAVALEGYASYRNYFQEALEKLSINVHVFKAGEHKSIAEPFLRNDMSPGEKVITQRWLDAVWSQFTADIEQRRSLEAGAIDSFVNQYVEVISSHGGDSAAAAQAAGLVDKLLAHRESNDYVASIVGATNDDGLYEAVPFEHYVYRKRPLTLSQPSGDRVAVVFAEGDIMPGEQPPGTIGGDTLARILRDTAGEDGVEAIVLRVNSGGGSVFASEVIRRAVIDVQSEGIPLVVSMGSVAASGGYYISASADLIYATPGTITGSIGVFAAFPTFEDLMGRLGVHTDGVGTTDLAGSLRVDRPLNPQLAEAFTRSVEFTYRNFLGLVAEGRGMSVEAVDKVAQGAVWSAQDALERGLVDRLGSLQDAIDAAMELAGLEGAEVQYVHPQLSPRDLLLQQLSHQVTAPLRAVPGLGQSAAISLLLKPMDNAVELIDSLSDPGHLYMHCIDCGLSL